ncbi:NAD kinase [Paracrocinitomix mangrovi]|uniref:NAD kinase n=1 Tax=Paracrocinitomix mangrovi TaxID=2862509 RepID=UPI001C8D07B2|nr:NAD kinase [Paracrocinitomix mangrovi]UKN01112.1 NAD kinase [Paracrocinitomix mangrovi]
MRVGIYGKAFDDSFIPNIQVLFNTMKLFGWEVTVYEPFLAFLRPRISMDIDPNDFNKFVDIKDNIDILLSIGGDGTFLETIHIVRDSGIPILGINTGRLGFLASTSRDNIKSSLQDIKDGKYRLQTRSLLTLETEDNLFGEDNFALNELTVHKKETSSMITIHTYIGDLYLNSYWADGLIVATPTGSTAYSLSCGGPIIVPGATDFVITPIAPHNLNVRPVVVPDSRTIRLKIEGRGQNYLCSLDSRSVTIDSAIELVVRKTEFEINVIQTEGQNFLNTIRNKMMWGLDRRN